MLPGGAPAFRDDRSSGRVRPWVALALCALATNACSQGPGSDETDAERGEALASPGLHTFVDAAGVPHTFADPANRIVSLVPSATATLRAIQADDALVGRTDFDTESWAQGLPSVGGGLDPSIEVLITLRPDLVIRFEGAQDPRTPARLDELGIRHVAVRPESLNDIYRTNAILGHVTGRSVAADSLTTSIRAGLEDLRRATERFPSVTFAYVVGGSPPFVAGPNTYIDEVLTLMGGENVFADLRAPYASVSPEELRARAIDVVLVAAGGQFDESLTPNTRIATVGDALETPGPGVVDAARAIAEAMHGRVVR